MQPLQYNLYTMPSCKRQKYYTRSHGAKQPGRSHDNAFCNIRLQTRISRRTWQHKTTTNSKNHAHMNNHNRCRTTRCRTTRCRTTRCRTQRRNRSRPVRPQPHPPHTRYLSSPAGATLPEKNAKIPAPASPQNEAHATSMQPWQCVLQHQVASPHLLTQMATQNDNNHAAVTLRSATRESTNSKNHAHMNNHSLQNTEEEPIAPGSTAAAPAAHEVPFIAGRSHFTRKNAKIPAPAFSQNEAHATSMQPLQCVLQHQVANPHLSTRMATQNDNNHAAITLRSATRTREPTNSKNHAHMNNHSLQNTEEEPIAPGSTAAAPAATHGTFHRRPEPLYRDTVSCPGFPQNEAHATSMQPWQCVLQHQVASPHLLTQMATQNDNNHAAVTLRSATREPTNSKNHAHMNNHSLQNTEEEPIAPGSTAAAPAAHEVPFIAGRSHFTRKNAKIPAPAFSQNEAHATSMQPLQCVLQHQVANLHLSTRMATQNDNNHAAITMLFASKDSHTTIHWV